MIRTQLPSWGCCEGKHVNRTDGQDASDGFFRDVETSRVLSSQLFQNYSFSSFRRLISILSPLLCRVRWEKLGVGEAERSLAKSPSRYPHGNCPSIPA